MESNELRWWIGGRVSRDDLHTMNRVREISKAEADRLRERFMFVVNLASQDTFAAVCASGNRCLELVEAAQSDLEHDRAISPRCQKAIDDEFAALGHLALRLDRELSAEIDKEQFDPLDVERYKQVRHRMRAAAPYLVATNLARKTGSGEIELVLRDGEVHFADLPSTTTSNVVMGLVGTVHWIVQAHQIVLRNKFTEIATEIDDLTGEVEKGQPSLIGLQIDSDSGEWDKPTLIDIPDYEVACIREELRQTGPPTEDQPSLLTARTRTYLEFGDADAGFAVIGASSRDGVNTLPSADFTIDAKALGHEPVDYWAPVSYALERQHPKYERFAGSVQEAKVDGDMIKLDCEGALGLIEHGRGGMVSAGMSDAETVRAMLMHAGLPDDLFPIDGPLDERPAEEFEVFVPIRGLEVDDELEVAGILLVPFERGQELVSKVERPAEDPITAKLIAEFDHADSYALARVSTLMPGDAEDRGLDAIEMAVSWFVTRQRYGTALLPDDTPQPFSRESALRSPDMGPVVYVRGTQSRRRWLRWPNGAPAPQGQEIDASSSILNPTPRHEIEINEQQALLALRRAATETDPLSRIQALWQAIEGYAARTKRRQKLFPREMRKMIIKAIPDDLSQDQRDVMTKSINKLNDVPLARRLEWRLDRDGVPISDGELALLNELRDVRNDVVHGRGAQHVPSTEKINQGVGIVARMLVYRLSSAGSDEPE